MFRHREDEFIVSNPAILRSPSVAAVIPIMGVVLMAFLIIGLALPVLPLHVHQDLANFGLAVVGIFVASWIVSTLIYRAKGFDNLQVERF